MTEVSSSDAAPTPVAANGKRILVVDDAPTMRLYYRQILEKVGFSVDEAANGVEAIEQALNMPYDLMIVDINMSPMDGVRFLKTIRKDAALQSVPAVVVSSESRDSARNRAYEAGANYFLVKPAEPGQLAAVVQRMTGVGSR